MRVDFLRKKYPKFIYENYSWKISGNNLDIFFDFKIEPDIHFRPKIIVKNIPKNKCSKWNFEHLENLIFHLGLMEIPSYWKATCSPIIEIQAGSLNKEQITWWKDLIIRGMGQFFYENKINFLQPDFLPLNCLRCHLKHAKHARITFGKNYAMASRLLLKEEKVLVPVGGGKDSVVTLEILKKTKKNITCFSLNPNNAAQKIMKIANCENPIIVRREIDSKLLELNKKGFLNGHTPFSAYLAFLSVLGAVLFNFKFIAFSNERSSNEGNLKYLGKMINHQYSKSFDFEKKFRDYSKKYLAPQQKGGGRLEYFSFLRPLYEIQVARLFSKCPKYFKAFLSCNESFKTNSGTKKPLRKWCGKCPKCLFVFASLYSFVDEKKLLKIFGKNLFEDENLLPTMLQLIEGEKFKPRSENLTRFFEKKPNIAKQVKFLLRGKPFECVGTKKESLVAFYLSWKKNGERFSVKPPFLLKYFEKKILPKYSNLEKESKKIMTFWNNQNYLPKEFEKILKNEIRRTKK